MASLIRGVQPRGPYRIIGGSIGGLIAYETAAILIGDGEKIDFLGLIDTGCPPNISIADRMSDIDQSLNAQLLRLCKTWLPQGSPLRDELQDLSTSSPAVEFDTLLSLCRQKHLLPAHLAGSSSVEVAALLNHRQAYTNAAVEYTPQPIPVQLTIFAAEEQPYGDDRCLGWTSVVDISQINVVRVPGDHMTIVQAPNVDVLSARISENLTLKAHAPRLPQIGHCSVQLISRARNKPAVYCIPGAGAGAAAFVPLANTLSNEARVYGFQPPGLEDRLPPFRSVEAAADRFLSEISPDDWVHGAFLVGHSFGGWIAYEMACRLPEDVQHATQLVLLDSSPPLQSEEALKEFNSTEVIMEWLENLELLTEKPFGIKRNTIDALTEPEQLELMMSLLIQHGLLPRAFSHPEQISGHLRCFAAAIRTPYTPNTSFKGSLHLMLAEAPRLTISENSQEHLRTVTGWRKFAANVAYHHGPGNHLTILKPPYVGFTAAQISKVLASS
jgi:thioesterase domain-containing protein